MIIEKIVITFLLMGLGSFIFIVRKHLFWGASSSKRTFAGYISISSHFVFIVPGMYIILQENPSSNWVIFILSSASEAFAANLTIVAGLFLFVLFSVLISILTGKSSLYNGHDFVDVSKDQRVLNQYRRLLRAFVISSIAVLLALIVFTSTQHALLAGLIGDIAPGAIRHENSQSSLGGLLNLFLQIYSLMMAIIAGIPGVLRNKTQGVLLAFLIVLIASVHGDKAPTIMAFLICVVTRFHFLENVNFMNILMRLGLVVAIAMGILIWMINFYFGELNISYGEYLSGRLLLGQVAGWYDQFSLNIQDFSYIFHGIPFYSFFDTPIIFHKDLMLVSEGRIDPNSIGVKNTLFLAEAYAIFGPIGYILGPLIMAFGSFVVFVCLSRIFNLFFGIPLAASKAISAMFYVIYFQLTDGITELIFAKSLILILIVLSPVYIVFQTTIRKNLSMKVLR